MRSIRTAERLNLEGMHARKSLTLKFNMSQSWLSGINRDKVLQDKQIDRCDQILQSIEVPTSGIRVTANRGSNVSNKLLWTLLIKYIEKQGGAVDPGKIRSDFFENLEDRTVTLTDMEMAMCHLIESGVIMYDKNMDVKQTGEAGL